jgi:hypothetical protein
MPLGFGRIEDAVHNPTLDLINQHLAVDHAQAVFFREIFYSDDRWHAERKKLEG